jgi:hypothetical protein
MNHGVSSTTWLKGRRHVNIEAIQAAAMMELTGIHQLLSGLAETLARVY